MSTDETPDSQLENLATYQRCIERIQSSWSDFLRRRGERLQPHPLFGVTPEKVTENILEDLFTNVLDWKLGDLHHQVEYADIVLANNGFKYAIVEAKRPQALAWHRRAVDKALDQARGYASAQKVGVVVISDGLMLYASDFGNGGNRDRVFVSLQSADPPTDLWWMSVQGIYRPRGATSGAELRLLPEEPLERQPDSTGSENSDTLLHPKYKLPSWCFAYVADYSKPNTWKLPYLNMDGTSDAKRLPKAIQAILSNYRGTKVSGIPEAAIPAVLGRLARAAAQAGHLPVDRVHGAPVYQQLSDALIQLGLSPEGN